MPTAIVTGSNGKTTTVRLLAACARAHGWPSAFCCTDGVFFDGTSELASGDYSGPEGARRVLRERRAQAAIIETARGGILRRGLAVSRAQVALVTNVSADHFGEYGIDDLAGLADVKLTVAGGRGRGRPAGAQRRRRQLICGAGAALAQRFGAAPPLGWFALDADNAPLAAHRAQRRQPPARCGTAAWCCTTAARSTTSARWRAMPLTVDGSATLQHRQPRRCGARGRGARASRRPPSPRCSRASARSAADNSGRMMRFERDGVQILVDYAHNPEGMRGLLRVADAPARRARGASARCSGMPATGRTPEIEALAQAAAEFHPDLVVVKESEAHLRGREPGEMPRMIHAALLRAGVPEEALPVRMSELAAVHYALDWARPGDVLALPVHSAAAREAVLGMLAA